MRITWQPVPIARRMHRPQWASAHSSTASVMLATRGKTGKCALSVPAGHTKARFQIQSHARHVPRFPTRLHRALLNPTVHVTHLLSSMLMGLAFVRWIRFMRITRQPVPIARQMHRPHWAAARRSTASVMLATRGKTGKCALSVPSRHTRVLQGRPGEFYQAMTSANYQKTLDYSPPISPSPGGLP